MTPSGRLYLHLGCIFGPTRVFSPRFCLNRHPERRRTRRVSVLEERRNLRETTIGRAQQGPLEAWSRINPFNNLVRNVEMKSTDRKILILVASLALLLAGCGGGSSTPPVEPGPTQGDMAISNAQSALSDAEAAASAAMTEDAKLAAYREVQRAADNLVAALTTHGGSDAEIAAAAGKSGNAKAMADNLARKVEDDAVAADAAMTAMAAKLYTVIGDDPLANNGRDSAVSPTGVLTVQNLDPPFGFGGRAAAQLKEDKSTMVAPLHGWTGSRHTATVAVGTVRTVNGSDNRDAPGTYTAHLYSDVGEPTQGAKFNTLANFDTTNGELPATGGHFEAANAAKIASPEFDHSAGVKPFKLPDPNPTGERIVTIDGSYDGVAGVYSCNTGTAGTGTCTVTKASGDGYTLTGTGSTWTFKPGNPEDTLAPTPDTVYPVYGWWLHEALDGTSYVSAFTSYRGTDGPVNLSPSSTPDGDPVNLHGTATYRGGAAGMYALQSATGGTNDAGRFTADAELKATFSTTAGGTFTTDINHKIEGTIDNFMGSDGMSRDWSVALKEGSIDFLGVIRSPKTIWSIGGTAAGESGQWTGNLYKQNDGGVPTVGTGVFHSEYENAGRMVGAFGVNLEE